MKRRVANLLIVLLAIGVAILILDAYLYHTDPFGTVMWFHSQAMQAEINTPAPHGYTWQPGVYDLRNFALTVTQAQTRAVPDTNPEADCTLAFIGDSITFGWGVEDAETFVNIIARQFPEVQFLNTARAGYSVENIAGLVQAYPADGYLWFIWRNDHLEAWEPVWADNPPRYEPAIVLYMRFWGNRTRQRFSQKPPQDTEQVEDQKDRFLEYAGKILQHKTLVFAVAGWEPGIWLEEVHEIAGYDTTVSKTDLHPDRAGHMELARQMMPDVQDFAREVCSQGQGNRQDDMEPEPT